MVVCLAVVGNFDHNTSTFSSAADRPFVGVATNFHKMIVRVLEVGTMIGLVRQGPVKVAIHFLPLHIHGLLPFARHHPLPLEAQLPSFFEKMSTMTSGTCSLALQEKQSRWRH